MIRRAALAFGLALLAGFHVEPAAAQVSTIDATKPVQGAPYNAAPIRDNFTAAAADINRLLRMSSGATAPSSPVTGQLWLDTSSATTYTLKIWISGSSAWLPVAALNVSAGIWAPPVGGGTIPSLTSASTVNLGSVPQAAINITGSQSIASFGSSVPEGVVKFLVFTGAPTLVYNATFMILPGGGNIALSAGDTAIALSLGGGRWRVGFGEIGSGAGLLVVTPTDRGATVAVGGTAQVLAASNSSRASITIQNPCTAAGQGGIAAAEDLFIAVNGSATVNGSGNYAVLSPCGSTSVTVADQVYRGAVSVNAATTGHRFYASEWQE